MQYPKKLKDKIKLICKLFHKPYYLMSRITAGTYMFEVFDGTSEGNPINWTGRSPADAVEEALCYLTHEIEVGAIEIPEEKQEQSKRVIRRKRITKKNKK